MSNHTETSGKRKAWWKRPGELFDAKNRPIYPGDLIRSPHFIGARNKRWYLYHTAVFVNGYMELVPTCHLQPENVKGGGRCIASEDILRHSEIIAGCGPEPYLDYTDRPKRNP
jgi:hypothetical protein